MARFIRILSALARESHNTGEAGPASGLTRALPAVSFGQLRDDTQSYTCLCQDFGISH
jgi:hypothetical protein